MTTTANAGDAQIGSTVRPGLTEEGRSAIAEAVDAARQQSEREPILETTADVEESAPTIDSESSETTGEESGETKAPETTEPKASEKAPSKTGPGRMPRRQTNEAETETATPELSKLEKQALGAIKDLSADEIAALPFETQQKIARARILDRRNVGKKFSEIGQFIAQQRGNQPTQQGQANQTSPQPQSVAPVTPLAQGQQAQAASEETILKDFGLPTRKDAEDKFNEEAMTGLYDPLVKLASIVHEMRNPPRQQAGQQNQPGPYQPIGTENGVSYNGQQQNGQQAPPDSAHLEREVIGFFDGLAKNGWDVEYGAPDTWRASAQHNQQRSVVLGEALDMMDVSAQMGRPMEIGEALEIAHFRNNSNELEAKAIEKGRQQEKAQNNRLKNMSANPPGRFTRPAEPKPKNKREEGRVAAKGALSEIFETRGIKRNHETDGVIY